MKKVKGRVLFNIAGLIIVVFWLVMLGLLVYREEAGSGSIPSVSGPESPLVHSAERTWKKRAIRSPLSSPLMTGILSRKNFS